MDPSFYKTFMLIGGHCKEPSHFLELRKISEKIAAYFGYKIDGYSLIYYDAHAKLKDTQHAYKEKYYAAQDPYSVDQLSFCSFATHPKKKQAIGQQVSIYFHSPSDVQKGRIAVVWESGPCDGQLFLKETKAILEILQTDFSTHTVLADCMRCEKLVELFVEGVEMLTQNAQPDPCTCYENQIARNINRSMDRGGGIPFLFSYTSLEPPSALSSEETRRLIFHEPGLLGEEFCNYSKNPNWEKCYTNWIRQGLIAPLQSIAHGNTAEDSFSPL